jgi:hypothetical protein
VKKAQHVLSCGGLTIIELIISTAILAIAVPTMITILNTVIQGFTGYEATQQLRRTNQKSLNSIAIHLDECKRIFSNDDAGVWYLQQIPSATLPAPVASKSKLPIIHENGTLSGVIVSTTVGNSLFFATTDEHVLASGITTRGGTTRSVKIRTYRFNYYYLTQNNPRSPLSTTACRLAQWRSIQYADYTQITALAESDSVAAANTVGYLAGHGISRAWDTRASTAPAIYLLSADGTTSSYSGSLEPAGDPDNEPRVLTVMMQGIMGGGFRYGISPNSASWSKAPKIVPRYAAINQNFPGGFEVIIVGPPSARCVLIRSVLVAQGSMSHVIGDDLSVTRTVTDL